MDSKKLLLFKNILKTLYYIIRESLILDVTYYLLQLMDNIKVIGIEMAI